MARVSPKHYPALVEEIRAWKEESIIDADVAQRLLTRYSVPGAGFNAVGALSTVGAVLVGLGTLLFISANWGTITAAVKVILIMVAIAVASFTGWRLKYEPGNRPKLGSAFLLLGSIFYGAGIFLLGQTFNLDPSFREGVLLWAIGIAPVALLTRSTPQALLFSLLTGTWMVATGEGDFVAFLVGITSMIGLAAYVRSPWTMAVSLVSGAIWAGINGHQVGLIAYGLALFSAFLLHKDHFPAMQRPYMYVGTITALLGMLALTFDKYASHSNIPGVSFLILMSVAAQVVTAFKNKKYMTETAVGLALLAGSCATLFIYDGLATPLIGNAIILTAIICLIVAGAKRYEIAGLITLSMVFFVIEIVARYFDFFFSMMDRSIFFVLGGIVLMAAGAAAERSRRKLIEGIC